MKKGIELITEERQRQIEKEGWTAEHDAEHKGGEIALAAVCYATPSEFLTFRPVSMVDDPSDFKTPELWPWSNNWFKPAPDNKIESRIRELQKAGALIAAEIDRLNSL